ncbi:Asp23/Gls24 family envelope stress response protein [Sporolactobacillus shoreicorticis]|uniref:Asp23/Gls24 family envelope stress response protein n=1 Tax=Sporolactobacillus shoreicorticis TaxID=1923877 RepID=A0ABW5S1Z9_9BACL|nr:Asp23/Gls24 family envelope stress response protein [Sporolactobacillus shoreicorticis]MCO7127974.1 Asp23/Gls24 family envelope stress response protein [Sporolactobacillus shoreicorticis]
MTVSITNSYGQIDISIDVIAKIVGGAAMDCLGIVGMASKNQLKDGFTELLKKENFSRGVVVRFDENQNLLIDMYIIVSYGTRISEVAGSVQTKVKETLNEMLGLNAASINIFVQGVRLTDEDVQREDQSLQA